MYIISKYACRSIISFPFSFCPHKTWPKSLTPRPPKLNPNPKTSTQNPKGTKQRKVTGDKPMYDFHKPWRGSNKTMDCWQFCCMLAWAEAWSSYSNLSSSHGKNKKTWPFATQDSKQSHILACTSSQSFWYMWHIKIHDKWLSVWSWEIYTVIEENLQNCAKFERVQREVVFSTSLPYNQWHWIYHQVRYFTIFVSCYVNIFDTILE